MAEEVDGTEPNGFLLGSFVGFPPRPNPPRPIPGKQWKTMENKIKQNSTED